MPPATEQLEGTPLNFGARRLAQTGPALPIPDFVHVPDGRTLVLSDHEKTLRRLMRGENVVGKGFAASAAWKHAERSRVAFAFERASREWPLPSIETRQE